MREANDWTDGLKWLMVVPAFLAAFLFLGVFFRFVLDLFLFDALVRNKNQLDFLLSHLYSDFICVAFSIYFSCSLAPKRRFTLACIYLALDLLFIPKRLEIAMTSDLYGAAPWKEPYMIALYLLAGMVPAVLFLFQRRGERKAEANLPI